MGLRFNPPPGWPAAPEGFTPAPGWQPDPAWPPPPPGWQLWTDDGQPPEGGPPPAPEAPTATGPTTATGAPTASWPPPATGAPTGTGHPTASGAYAPYPVPGQYPVPGPYGVPGAYGPGAFGPGGQTSGWAIASLVVGILGGGVLGIIFGGVALSRISRLGQKGRGMAIAGIVVSCVWIVGTVLLFGVAYLSTAGRSPSNGAITQQGGLSIFSLRTGDCFDNPADAAGAGLHTVETVTAVPCTTPHNAQVFATFNLTGSNFSYPGTEPVHKLATQGCNARIGSINKNAVNNSMTVRMLFPLQDSWIDGRRSVSCLVVSPAENITSSLLNPPTPSSS